MDYKAYLLDIIDELADLELSIHLAYFRYIDISHCYCNRCITNFAKSYNFFQVKPSDIIKSSNVFLKWIDWRSNQLNIFLKEAKERINKSNQKISLSVEIDIDSHKGFLLGVKIDEGQDLFGFVENVDEFILHFESYGWETLEGIDYERRINLLKYIIAYLKQKNKKTLLMFWKIDNATRFKKAIDIHLKTNPDGSLFYYEPHLFKWISENI